MAYFQLSLLFAVVSSAAPIAAPTAYEHALAERLVNFAGASYCAGQPSVASWSCYACNFNPGFQNITSVHDKSTDGRGILGYDPVLKARVVAFMGTNLNVSRTPGRIERRTE